MNAQINTAQHSNQRPVVGAIYHDKLGRSLVVLSIVDNKALLEYASGDISTIDVNVWQKLQLQMAVY